MVAATLPPAPSTQARSVSDTEKLDQLPAPANVKAAWQKSAQDIPGPSASDTPRAQKKQPQRTSVPPNESFVLLQESVIRNIPSPLPSPTQQPKKQTFAKSRNSTQPLPAPVPAPEEATHPNPSPLSHHLRSTLRLFNLLSSRTDLDHPLCAECTHVLLTNLTRQLEETKKERDGYIAFEKEVKKEKEREGDGISKAEAEAKIEKLKEDERIATEQLKAAEREHEQLETELKGLELEEQALAEEEAE